MSVQEADSIDTTTRLAVDRTRLAHDRTVMAWIRTATSLITFGFSVFNFFEFQKRSARSDLLLGPRGFAIIMICSGLLSLLMATIQHRFEMKRLRSLDPEVPRSNAAILAGIIAVLGLAALMSVIMNL